MQTDVHYPKFIYGWKWGDTYFIEFYKNKTIYKNEFFEMKNSKFLSVLFIKFFVNR